MATELNVDAALGARSQVAGFLARMHTSVGSWAEAFRLTRRTVGVLLHENT